MKRALKITALVLLVLVAIPIVALAITFAGTASIIDGKELPGGARLVKDGIVSVAVIPAGENAVVLVDCGNDPNATAVLAELRRRELGPDAVKAILLTHGHRDHVHGCHVFAGAEVYAMAAEQDLLEGRAGSRSPMGMLSGKRDTGVRVKHALQDGAMFGIGSLTCTAYAIPGHTDGSAAYFINGVVYLGDSADATTGGKLAPAKWLFSNDREQNRASLKRLAERLAPQASAVKWLEFAHSAPLEGLGPLTAFAQAK